MATYQNEAILIKAPELPLKHIEIAPQIKGEILKAGAEVFFGKVTTFLISFPQGQLFTQLPINNSNNSPNLLILKGHVQCPCFAAMSRSIK